MERTKARTDREAIRDGEQVVETTGTAQSTNTVSKLFKMAGEPCKPDSVRCTALQQRAATIIPLGRTSRCGSSNLPEGSHSDRLAPIGTERAFLCRNANSTGRASPPLLFGLAPRGVCHASAITDAAVGSYPTFSPLPAREP